MKIKMQAEQGTGYNDYGDKRKEKQDHKRFRELRKNRNNQWQAND